jgi:hypothetical protein
MLPPQKFVKRHPRLAPACRFTPVFLRGRCGDFEPSDVHPHNRLVGAAVSWRRANETN